MSDKNKTKNDKAWYQIFKEYKIPEEIERNGLYTIDSKTINRFRESRLMTKLDHEDNLPVIFREHGYTILPITRGDYVISNFDTYHELSFESTSIHHMDLPEHIQSIDVDNITTESLAINCAYISGIFSDFLSEESLIPTINGRMSSGVFNYNINLKTFNHSIKIQVENSQMEIDGGFEGFSCLCLVEAKNSISKDFLVRQLYYPFRLWSDKIGKEVKPVYMVYTNGIFYLFEYSFEEPQNYNSLVLKNYKRYSLEKIEITLDDIVEIQRKCQIEKEPELPFPQADSFSRVVNLCELLNENKELYKETITTTYDFDPRQTDYYANAGRYLGIIKKENADGVKYSLTKQGFSLFKMNYRNRQLKLVELVLKHSVFNKVFSAWLSRGDMPAKEDVVAIMKHYELYNVNKDVTYYRRSSTILSWLDWVLSLQSL